VSVEQAERARAYTLREAAVILGVSVTAVRRRVASGQIRAERVERPQGSAWRVFLDAPPPSRSTGEGERARERHHAPGDAPQPEPGAADVAALIALVGQLADKLAASNAAAAMWQERARVLADRLALAAPDAAHSPGASNPTREPSDPAPASPTRFSWPAVRPAVALSGAEWVALVAVLLIVAASALLLR
jgi:excisionase family DNA binding protein